MKNKEHLILIPIILLVVIGIIGVMLISSNTDLKNQVLEIEEINIELQNRNIKTTNELDKLYLELSDVLQELDSTNRKIEDLHIENEELKQVIKEKDTIIKNLKKSATQNREINPSPTRSSSTSGGRLLKVQATAYCPCTKCCGPNAKGITATGTKVKAGRTIAVDPKVIPLGSTVKVEGYGTYVAEDTGSAVKGNIIDIYFDSHSEALKFGRKNLVIRVP